MHLESFFTLDVAMAKSCFSVVESFLPCLMGKELSWVDWDKVPDWPTKEDLGGGQLGIPVRGVSVLQYCTLKLVSIKSSVGSRVVHK